MGTPEIIDNTTCLLCNEEPHAANCPHEHPGVQRLFSLVRHYAEDHNAVVRERDALGTLLGRISFQILTMNETEAGAGLAKEGIRRIINLFRSLLLANPNIQNFSTGDINSRWYVTFQRRDGITPAEHIHNLQVQMESLTNENARLVRVVEEMMRENTCMAEIVKELQEQDATEEN